MGMVVYLKSATQGHIEQLKNDPDWLDQFMFEQVDGSGSVIDFDKAWHALHFMLTGTAGISSGPLNLLCASDAQLIGTDVNGFGGYWIAQPEQVKAFAKALNAISDAELKSRYDPSAMSEAQIYMGDIFEEEGLDALPYVMQGVPDLRTLVNDASTANQFVIGCLM